MPGQLTIVYTDDAAPDDWTASVFLAGPTPRDPAHGSWRPEALRLLAEGWSVDGRLAVFVPQTRDGSAPPAYERQLAWEERWLSIVDCMLFWVPREMDRFPGLTTNVEFGRYESSGRMVFGSPPNAVNNRYLEHHARQHGVPVRDTLSGTVDAALEMIGAGAYRVGGHRDAPLLLWRMPEFTDWVAALEAAGDQLRSVRVAWTWGGFFAALRASVWVAAERRVKDAEVVLLRPTRCGKDDQIVVVRELESS